MKDNVHLLVIDPQNDFCDLPDDWCPPDPLGGGRIRPALPVRGAHADLQRLARLLREGASGIAGITVTLDSHHRLHIAHPTFWRKGDGGTVAPFTQITAAQVRAGEYEPRAADARARALSYLDRLEAAGRYTLMVWPVHCEIGSWGHNVHAGVRAAYNAWEDLHVATVNTVLKGGNLWTEHYSAIRAEVVDDAVPETGTNQALLDLLAACDRVYIAGEAASHCVRATTEHIAEHFGDRVSRLVLVSDCMSPVAGFEEQCGSFIGAMRDRGVRIADSATVLRELIANGAAA